MAKKKRNYLLALVAKNDPARYRTRTVKPEKGKGRKNRPRRKDWSKKIDDLDYAA